MQPNVLEFVEHVQNQWKKNRDHNISDISNDHVICYNSGSLIRHFFFSLRFYFLPGRLPAHPLAPVISFEHVAQLHIYPIDRPIDHKNKFFEKKKMQIKTTFPFIIDTNSVEYRFGFGAAFFVSLSIFFISFVCEIVLSFWIVECFLNVFFSTGERLHIVG